MQEIWKVYKDTRHYNAYGDISMGALWEVSKFGRVKRNGWLYDCPINKGCYVFACGTVHRAVAKLFIPNPENKPEVDHIDTDPLNNHVSNLQWCTHKENCNNPLTRKHVSNAMKGENNPMFGKNSEDYMTPEAIQEKRRKQTEAQSGENNPFYNKTHTQESLDKMSEKQSGENNPFYNKHHTEESNRRNQEWHQTHKMMLCEDGKRHWVEI